jgi:hypothetical protein
MNIFKRIILLVMLYSGFGFACLEEPVLASGDFFERSASIYLVCPSISNFSDTEAKKTVEKLLGKYEGIAPEIFIQFLASNKYIGYMEKSPYTLPNNELVADYYSGTGRLYFWPKTENKRYISIERKSGSKP